MGGGREYFAPSPLQYKTFTTAWGGDWEWIYLVILLALRDYGKTEM